MTKNIFYLLILATVSSCAFNGMFLHPFELNEDSSFKGYSDKYNDTIELSFLGDQPVFNTLTGEKVKHNYTIESQNFIGSKGDTLNSWFLKPNENYNGKTIYFLHGNAGNVVFQYRLVEPFVKRGYQLFMIDYSGFGFSTGESTRSNVVQNGYDGMEHLLNMEDLQYEQLFIYGQSLGGHLASVVANKYEDQIDGLIVEGAFNSHKAVAATRIPILPWVFVKEMYSGKDSIQEFNKPFLSIHSEEDKTVKYKLGKKLYDKGNEPKWHYKIDSCHICGPLYYADSIIARMNKMTE